MQTRVLTTRDHSRALADNRYVYAVLSRRSSGISIGINLNPDKICNFDCAYCQVDRIAAPIRRRVDLNLLEIELGRILEQAASGALYARPPFASVPEPQRCIKDIAFSGDGEPTTYARFGEAVEIAIRAKKSVGLDTLKIVLITNAATLHRAKVGAALAVLDAHQGEIWAKLDAGTEEYFRRVDVTAVPFDRVLKNILDAARVRPIVIQSMFARFEGSAPDEREVEAYCGRLAEIAGRGGRIRLVQIYTVARRPAQPYVTPLSNEELDAIAARVERIPLPVAQFYSASDRP
jgi:wyosine [tRNA(Phe)-imidazoG37] synthetase (radical SAM superfamily)